MADEYGVLGATGQQGGAVVRSLVNRGYRRPGTGP